MATIETLSAQIQSLTEKVDALMVGKAPAKGSKKPKDPDAPKKEATWWVKATQHVRAALKEAIEAHNAGLAEGGKKLAGTVPVTVASMLKAKGLLSADSPEPSEEDILEAFEEFLANPPEPKGPALRAAAAAKKAGSVASTGSKASTASAAPSVAKAEPSEEEKKAIRAQKAAATRAANKAKKAEAEAKPVAEAKAEPAPKAEPVAVAQDEEVVVEAYIWTGDIGKGEKAYERIDYEGRAYIYTTDSDYLGVWDEKAKKMDKSIPDIQ